MFCIILSTVTFILQTIRSLENHWSFDVVDILVSVFFTLEYGAKILTCRNMWEFFSYWMNIIDFLAIVPFFIELSFNTNNSGDTLRVIRVIRLTRLLKLLRSPSFRENL